MELTGKCKEDFENWLNKEMYYLGRHKFEDRNNNIEDLSDNFQNTLIIDFFDSVGIYILVELYKNLFDNSNLYFCFKIIDYIPTVSEKTIYKTRLYATTEAIKKANEIYNENY